MIRMKLFICALILIFGAGCRTDQAVCLTHFRLGAVDLDVEVLAVQSRHDSASNRYEVELRVISPAEKSGQTLTFIVDGISDYWSDFTKIEAKWRIHSDLYVFEKSTPFSFWHITELDPMPLDKVLAPTDPSVEAMQ